MALYKFGFIGTGNMGGALASAVCAQHSKSVILSDANIEKSEKLAQICGCSCGDVADVVKNSKFIFLGVKPQVMKNLIDEIAPILAQRDDRFILVSMAAGLSISSFNEMLGCKYPIIRIMPNTPVSMGKGMILYCACPAVSEDEKNEFIDGLQYAGKLDEIGEGLINAASAVSGCGPAFVYLFAEAMADAGVECGLPREKAMLYAFQTVSGAAELLLESGKHPAQLKDDVCSPGGTTIEGVHALENSGFRGAVMDAVKASFEKTKKIGK